MAQKIPFDSLCLACVADELEPWVGAKIQGVWMPDARTLILELYGGQELGMERLLLCSRPEWARCGFTSEKPGNAQPIPSLAQALRARTAGSHLSSVQQIAGDRLLELKMAGPQGDLVLRAELMGTQGCLVLTDHQGRILAADHLSESGKSARTIRLNQPYVYPPSLAKGEDLKPGPFLRELLEKVPASLALIEAGKWRPVRYEEGVYPVPVPWLKGEPVPEFGKSMNDWFRRWIRDQLLSRAKSELRGILAKTIKSRQAALKELHETEAASQLAPRDQMYGELILSSGDPGKSGENVLNAFDYEGQPAAIRLDPEKSRKDNALDYFAKAKRAKRRAMASGVMFGRITDDIALAEKLIERAEAAQTRAELEPIESQIKERRWRRSQGETSHGRAVPKFEGKKIKELTGPHGEVIYLGENAEANDYLTARLGRPNDYWLHVRGGTSAHVLILTNNHPEAIARDTLEFAARLAVLNSPSRHASTTSVDFTLKKHVRRLKGSAPGSVTYSHEKTIQVYL